MIMTCVYKLDSLWPSPASIIPSLVTRREHRSELSKVCHRFFVTLSVTGIILYRGLKPSSALLDVGYSYLEWMIRGNRRARADPL